MSSITDNQGTSTRPYLLRALHDWCTDNGFTPYIAVHVDDTVQVPMEHVKNNEIVLNVGFEATSGLKLGNEAVEFRARFGGVSRDIVVPIDHVVAIYARENGQGMAFPVPPTDGVRGPVGVPASSAGGTAQLSAVVTTPNPERGLRLASSGDAATATRADAAPASGAGAPKRAATAPVAVPPATDEPPGDEPPEPPGPPRGPQSSPPAGPRPALKRVK